MLLSLNQLSVSAPTVNAGKQGSQADRGLSRPQDEDATRRGNTGAHLCARICRRKLLDCHRVKRIVGEVMKAIYIIATQSASMDAPKMNWRTSG